MREYHLNADGKFIIRENGKLIACLEPDEIAQFGKLVLPAGCTEVLHGSDCVTYTVINKSMEGHSINLLTPLIRKRVKIIEFYEAKLAAAAVPKVIEPTTAE
jgi:hypothetical protein